MATAADDGDLVHLHPFTEQEPFLRDGEKYYGYISGVGAGKTFAGILRTACNVEEWNPGEMGAIVAPTATMIKDVIIPQMREVGLLDHWDYKGPHSDEPGLHAPNGARVLLLSADNSRTIERLAGLNLAWFWLDEASRVPQRALEILTQRLRVGAYRNGFVTTTPMGRDHIYDFFVGDVDGVDRTHADADLYVGDDRLAILRVPTWANPHTPEDYKQQMDQKEGQVYEREILGRFVDYEGLVYGWFDDSNVCETNSLPTKSFRQTIYGVDWGYNNPAVVLAIRETANGEFFVVDEFYEPRHTDDDLAGVVQNMYDDHGRGPVYCDPAEPDSIETFGRYGLDATGANNSLEPGIRHVAACRSVLSVTDTCSNLIDEFGLYRYPDSGDGEKPVDANNHALDALRYALFTHDQQGLSSADVGVFFE